MQFISYELKYCERCGSLRLRCADSAENYCPQCAQALARAVTLVALPRKPEPKSRLAKRQPPVFPGGARVKPVCGLSPQANSQLPTMDLGGGLQ